MEKHATRVEVEERQTGRHQRCIAPARTRKIREVAAAYHIDWIKRNTAAENKAQAATEDLLIQARLAAQGSQELTGMHRRRRSWRSSRVARDNGWPATWEQSRRWEANQRAASKFWGHDGRGAQEAWQQVSMGAARRDAVQAGEQLLSMASLHRITDAHA
jgi:hypothetical protein